MSNELKSFELCCPMWDMAVHCCTRDLFHHCMSAYSIDFSIKYLLMSPSSTLLQNILLFMWMFMYMHVQICASVPFLCINVDRWTWITREASGNWNISVWMNCKDSELSKFMHKMVDPIMLSEDLLAPEIINMNLVSLSRYVEYLVFVFLGGDKDFNYLSPFVPKFLKHLTWHNWCTMFQFLSHLSRLLDCAN